MLGGYKKLLCCGCGGGGEREAEEAEGSCGNARVADEPESVKGAARRFSWKEIEALTGGFTSTIVGEGGFSNVYLARLPGRQSSSSPSSSSSSLAAVKVHRSSERLRRAFRQELDVLLRVQHPYVVRLLGFCDEQEEGVLVLEFAPNGNLHDKLHGGGSLIWPRRIGIAYQAAKALEYLHEGCESPIVHGDIKASNILLDDAMSVKLCDFGSARVGFSAAVQPRSSGSPITGSPGYVDPHYVRSGMVTKKSDLYSFGVLLLELLTGIEAFCTRNQQLIATAVGSRLRNGAKVEKLVDPRLRTEYDVDEAAAIVSMATMCIGDNPSLRPSMPEVVRMLEREAAASIAAVGANSTDGRKVF